MPNDSFYVTTPIYYVNDKPHIGHAYTTILADVLARYNRLLGRPTFFLTGTDEHGQKVQQAARQHGVTPQEHCDETVKRFQELWERLEITSDDFIRTTEERHKKIVQAILSDLMKRGQIYSASYKGWYCVPDERFFMGKDLVDGCCPECHRPVEEIEERSYFFRMSEYQNRLIAHIEANPDFIQPAHRRQETLSFLQRQPLGDLCISRPKSRLSWGIELPFDTDYVTYVWFDALVNYISAVGYLADDDKFRRWWPASYHLIGKDILTTHTVYWPTMLMAMGVELPKAVFAHGWWLVGDDKMSKSLGNVINPMEMIDRLGVDAFRYFLMAGMSLGHDASFTERIFIERYNTDLANDLGNLVSRASAMVKRHLGGKVPEAAEIKEEDKNLVDTCLQVASGMVGRIANLQLDQGLAEVMTIVREGNRYFDQMKPWALAKEGRQEELSRVLRHTLECLRIAAGLLYPVIPGKMATLRRELGIPEGEIEPRIDFLSMWNKLIAGNELGDLAPLFPRAEMPEEEAKLPSSGAKAPKAESKNNGKKQSKAEEPVGIITIAEVGKVQLKTAEVISAERVPDAEKLLKLTVQIGAEKRQIVSGIAQYYEPEELLHKQVVVVTNLKPVVLRGVESNGMLLAASAGKKLRLVTVDGPIATGASVG